MIEMSKVDIQPGLDWFEANDWKPFPFQKEAWEKYLCRTHQCSNGIWENLLSADAYLNRGPTHSAA